MTQHLEHCVISILDTEGEIVGAGFVVSDRIAVTCAHVVQAAGSKPGFPVLIRFFVNSVQATARVLTEGWSSPDDEEDANDVAFLVLEHLPEGIMPAVLGSAQECNGHHYRALGFPRLADYEVRWIHDKLGGVVPIVGKHSMLQCGGEDVKQGMSGAPILDLQSNRVVGMVSEYKDDERRRFAWATTSDTLVTLHPSLQLWPDTYGPGELDAYLDYLIESNQMLILPDGSEAHLERLYVSLRADEMNSIERQAEHDIYLEDVVAFQRLVGGSEVDQYMLFAAIRNVIVRHPTMLMLEARDWERLFGQREQDSLNLAEVIQRHPYVVLLGDPGSGKTTLGKWLILQLARALREKQSHVLVRSDYIRAGSENHQLIDLGLARLPIFIRITDYARARWNREQGDTELPLERFVGFHHNPKVLPSELTSVAVSALIQDYIKRGQAFIVLDGLDEVGDPAQRRAVMQAVKKFLQDQLPTAITARQYGNCVLLTSRIVGYQFQPLTHLPHYTIEDMDQKAILAFCQAWMAYTTGNEDAAIQQGRKVKDAIFDHAHPSVRAMAGNPLLLTILAQVYQSNTEHTLPTRRVELFDEAIKTFYGQRKAFWERAGIRLEQLTHALGAVAVWLHTNEMTGFAEESDVREQLGIVLGTGQVETVLDAAREASGFLIARGEGVYGFLHRALQEYFVAKYLTDRPDLVVENLSSQLLNPLWREPVILAVGVVSKRNYPGSRRRLAEVFRFILNAPDPAGDFLPRRELLAVAACLECERVPPEITQQIVQNLLAHYTRDIEHVERNVLQKRIEKAFITLHNSSAGEKTEVGLCDALIEGNFETRYAALNIVIESQWDSPLIARAIVVAWCKFANPVSLSLIALDGMLKRHPDYFRSDFLPLRQALETDPLLWSRIEASLEWQTVIRMLYLPAEREFCLENINRDSPLTPIVLAALQQVPVSNPLIALRNNLLQLIGKPETAQTRDASAILGILGDGDWVANYAGNADTHQLLSLISYLLYILSNHPSYEFAFDLADDLLQRSHTFGEDLNIREDFFSYLRDRGIEVSDEMAFDLYDISIDVDRISAFSDRLTALFTFHSEVFSVSCKGSSDTIFDRDLFQVYGFGEDIRYLQSLAETIHNDFHELHSVMSKYAHLNEWFDPFMISLRVILTAVQTLQDILAIYDQTLEVLVTLIKAYSNMESKSLENEISTNIMVEYNDVTTDNLATLIAHLTNPNDKQREDAKKVLVRGHLASKLGKSLIEQIATYTLLYAENPRISTQLNRTLQAIVYDTPLWVIEWITQAGMEKKPTPAEIILSHMRNLTFPTFKALMEEIPYVTVSTKMVLLKTISWLARSGRLLKGRSIYKQLLTWLDRENVPRIRCAIIRALGYHKEDFKALCTALLARVNNPVFESDLSALYMALAHLATYQPDIASSVQPLLHAASSAPEGAAAFVRLKLAEATRQWRVLGAEVHERQRLISTTFPALRRNALFNLSHRLLIQSKGSFDEDYDPFDEDYDSMDIILSNKEKQEIISTILLSLLATTLSDPFRCLQALLDAGTDDDIWSDEYHGVLANTIRIHLERNADLLPVLLTSLKQALLQETWPSRRIRLAAVAACIETMPIAVQRACKDHLEALLVKGATDTDSSTTRRYALTSLSYLRTVTKAIIPALLLGCLDTEAVQRDVIIAAARFQSIEGDLLPTLLAALNSESATTIYAVTQLLSALGTSVVGDTAHLREPIIEALVDALKRVSGQQTIILSSGEYLINLEEIIYTALLQVTGWR